MAPRPHFAICVGLALAVGGKVGGLLRARAPLLAATLVTSIRLLMCGFVVEGAMDNVVAKHILTIILMFVAGGDKHYGQRVFPFSVFCSAVLPPPPLPLATPSSGIATRICLRLVQTQASVSMPHFLDSVA